MLLKYLELSQYFRLRSLILLAHSVEIWYDSKYYRDAAEDMWYSMHLMWPAKTAGSDNNIVMDRLRRFLDELNEDILEDRPGNWYNPEGLIEYESVPDEDEDEDEMSHELEDGDLFEEHVDVSGQEEQEADMPDQEKGTEDEEQILEDTKSQQSDDSERRHITYFEPQIFPEAFKKVTGDDHSVASADTNKQDESDSTLHLRDFHKLFAANKSVAGVDRIESQTETIVTNKSSPETLKIDGNMIEEANAQLDKSSKGKEAEPKRILDRDKIDDLSARPLTDLLLRSTRS
ncbi:MAG: putative 1,4-glycogen branching enzyme [Aureobasidium pullulans]|nr:MAG: putative 1,4-glycogen branching enzyme [Aureobasidium pullulans]